MDDDAGFESVLRAAQRGEPWACARIWTGYAAQVVGFARSRGCREPEDLASEVFLSLFRGLAGFVGDEAAFRGHLFTIARRRLVDDHRVSTRRVQQQAWSDAVPHLRAASAEEEVMAAMSGRRCGELLAGLTPDQREVLMLRLVADLSLDQVATVMSRSPGAVKALQHRALETLRRQQRRTPLTTVTGEERAL